jgi:hypothetical protein
LKAAQMEKKDFREIDREGGDYDYPSTASSSGDRFGKRIECSTIIMQTIAVRRLHNDNVSLRGRLGCAKQWMMRTAEVTAEENAPLVRVAALYQDRRGAQDVAGMSEGQAATSSLEWRVEGNCREVIERLPRLRFGVQGKSGCMLGIALPICVIRLLLL